MDYLFPLSAFQLVFTTTPTIIITFQQCTNIQSTIEVQFARSVTDLILSWESDPLDN